MAPKGRRPKNKNYEAYKQKIAEALKAMENGLSSINAARVYEISKSTLIYHKNKPFKEVAIRGPKLLTPQEEKIVVNFIEDALRRSLKITKESILEYVGKIIQDKKNKNNGRLMPAHCKTRNRTKPGSKWFGGFLKRNFSMRVPESISTSRANVTENSEFLTQVAPEKPQLPLEGYVELGIRPKPSNLSEEAVPSTSKSVYNGLTELPSGIQKTQLDPITRMKEGSTSANNNNNKVKQELGDESTNSWSYVKKEIKTENEIFEDTEETKLYDSCNQFQFKPEHIELKEEAIHLEEVPGSINDPNFSRKGSSLNDQYSEGDDAFQEQGNLNSGQNSNSWKCIKCEKSFRNNRNLKVHTLSVHEKLKPFKCTKCDYSCFEKRKLSRHFKTVHEKLKEFKCPNCNYASSEKGPLALHILSVHEKFKPFKCNDCDYSCYMKLSLSRHIRSIHIKLKPFKCNYCDYASHEKRNLSLHVKAVHDKLKSFKCNHCDFASSQKGQLLVHLMSVHEKLKPFKCNDCNYSCNQKSHLSNHVKSFHKNFSNQSAIIKL